MWSFRGGGCPFVPLGSGTENPSIYTSLIMRHIHSATDGRTNGRADERTVIRNLTLFTGSLLYECQAVAIEEAISFGNLGEIWSGPLALRGSDQGAVSSLHCIYLNVEGWRSISCTVRMTDIEVLFSLLKALTNCSFKISTWSVGSDKLMPSFCSGTTPELSHVFSELI